MSLDRYQEMRDFEKTAEPSGAATEDVEISEFERKGTPRFIVQEHHATALHWDFRLERNGVLVSWALPKGVPADPRRNHLAVHTEDHPLGYLRFEGAIPPDEYGGGAVEFWDRGTYEQLKWNDDEVIVVLDGRRVTGKYVLFQTDGKNWMIHRMDPPQDPAREQFPQNSKPVAPRIEKVLPVGSDWRYVIAWKGERVALEVYGGRCIARNEKGNNVNKKSSVLPAFGRSIGSLPVVFGAQLVGDTVFLDDVFWIDGHSTSALGFTTRRSLLEGLGIAAEHWKTSPAYDDGAVVLDAAKSMAQRGVYALASDQTADKAPILIKT